MYKRFILDVDGVLNDGMLYWGVDGKPFKAWPITESRVITHMKFPCSCVKEADRLDFVLAKGDPTETVFMGDGPYDAKIFPHVGLSIAPAQAWRTAVANATYVTERDGGKGAVMDACVYIMDKMGIEHGF